jgi:flagellar hook-associated protein 1 FlgK
MSISRIFSISQRALATYQKALDVTSHNVANSSNPNYTRQKVILSNETPEMINGYVWGSGVKIDNIQRVRNNLIDAQVRSNNQSYSYNNQKQLLLGSVEDLFTEPSDLGIDNLMSDFLNSWSKLSVTPNSTTLRANVISAAQQLSSKVSSISEGLDTAKGDILTDLKTKVETVNTYVKQVQSLNQQIFSTEKIGGSASDLLDQRDKVLDQLSNLVNVTISYDSDNSANISIGGVFAADRQNAVKFSLDANGDSLSLVSEGGAIVNLSGGEIGASAEVYSKSISEYQKNLDTVMTALVDSVNTEHQKGYTLGENPVTGLNFFEKYKSGSLVVSQNILDDNSLIAVSADKTTGNGDVATAIGNLADKKLINGYTLSETYAANVSAMGSDVQNSTQLADSTQLVLESLQKQKTSYSSVSVDEEMTNVIQFQRAYQASARLVTVADEMIKTLIDMV